MLFIESERIGLERSKFFELNAMLQERFILKIPIKHFLWKLKNFWLNPRSLILKIEIEK